MIWDQSLNPYENESMPVNYIQMNASETHYSEFGVLESGRQEIHLPHLLSFCQGVDPNNSERYLEHLFKHEDPLTEAYHPDFENRFIFQQIEFHKVIVTDICNPCGFESKRFRVHN